MFLIYYSFYPYWCLKLSHLWSGEGSCSWLFRFFLLQSSIASLLSAMIRHSRLILYISYLRTRFSRFSRGSLPFLWEVDSLQLYLSLFLDFFGRHSWKVPTFRDTAWVLSITSHLHLPQDFYWTSSSIFSISFLAENTVSQW